MTDTTSLPAHLPALHPGLEVVDFDESIVVFDDRSNRAHELTWVSAAVFDACRERLTTAAVVAELVAAGIGDEQSVRSLVATNLESFDRNGLTADSVPPPPCIGCGQASAVAPRRQRGRR